MDARAVAAFTQQQMRRAAKATAGSQLAKVTGPSRNNFNLQLTGGGQMRHIQNDAGVKWQPDAWVTIQTDSSGHTRIVAAGASQSE